MGVLLKHQTHADTTLASHQVPCDHRPNENHHNATKCLHQTAPAKLADKMAWAFICCNLGLNGIREHIIYSLTFNHRTLSRKRHGGRAPFQAQRSLGWRFKIINPAGWIYCFCSRLWRAQMHCDQLDTIKLPIVSTIFMLWRILWNTRINS